MIYQKMNYLGVLIESSLHYFNNLIKIYLHINFMGGRTMGAGRKKTTLKMSRKKAQAKLKARIQKRIDAAKK